MSNVSEMIVLIILASRIAANFFPGLLASFKMADPSESPVSVTQADSAPKGFSKLFNYIKILYSGSWFIAETANDA